MRSLLSKTTAMAAALFMVLGLMAAPSVDAQTYPPSVTGQVLCSGIQAPSISINGTSVDVTYPQGTLTCGIRAVVSVNPTLYDGPIPTGLAQSFPLPALEGDNHTATVVVTFTDGTTRSASVSVSAASLAAARSNFAASGLAGSASATGVPAAGATGASVAVPAQNLAFTGGDVNFPLAAGALLIGAGGLTLLAARKREQNA